MSCTYRNWKGERKHKAKRLYEDAFKPEKSLSLKELIESVNAYFAYMGDHFGHI